MRISQEVRNLCFEGGKGGRVQSHRVPKFVPDGIEPKFLLEKLKATRASRNRPAQIITPSPLSKSKTPPPPTPSSPLADSTPNENYAIIHKNDVAKAIKKIVCVRNAPIMATVK